MGDILKEAIADAKAVRETALQNAKMALEEAFTPQLKSMLSAKLKEDEFGDEEVPVVAPEEEDELGAEVPIVAPEEGDEMGLEVPVVAPEEQEEFPAEPVAAPVVAPEEDDELGLGGEEGVVEINGVKYAPVVSEDEAEVAIGGDEEVGIEDDNLDLESIIRELEDELGDEEVNEEDDAYDEKQGKTDASHLAEEDDAYDENVEGKEQPEHVGGSMDGVPALKEGEGDEEEFEVDESLFREGDEEDEEEVTENNDVSSGIGTGDNKEPAANAKTASTEDPGDSTEVKDMNGVAALKAENKEYKSAVLFLKNKLHEVNILNAKLLFTNKLFKEFALNNNQKLKVVETFDRTQSTREIKLVYSTLAEQFGDNGSVARKKSLKESASTKSGSTKPSKGSRKVISEENNVANRFKKLAGIL